MKTRLKSGFVPVTLVAALLLVGCSDSIEPSISGSVSVTPTGQTVTVGGSVKLFATGRSEGGPYALGSVTWSSDDESVTRVTSSRIVDVLGLGIQVEATVEGIGEGTARITATTERAGEASAEVTIVP